MFTLKDKEFKLSTLVGSRTVTLGDNNQIEDELGEVDWYDYQDSINEPAKILFRKDGGHKFVMQYSDKYAEFIGRSSMAEVRLSPIDKDAWKSHKRLDDSTGESFKYLDRPPVEYNYAPFETDLPIDKKHSHAVLLLLEALPTSEKTIVDVGSFKKVDKYAVAIQDEKSPFSEARQANLLDACEKVGIIPYKTKDIGHGRLLIHSLCQLFDAGYSEVTVLDANLESVVNLPQFITQVRKAAPNNVGIIQGWVGNLKQDNDFADTLAVTFLEDLRAYSLSSEVFFSIKESLLKFRDLFLKGPYETRPHRSIQKWLLEFSKENFRSSEDGIILTEDQIIRRGQTLRNTTSTVEFALLVLLDSKGWVRIRPEISRVKLLDDRTNSQAYLTNKYEHFDLKTFGPDTRRKNFSFI